MPPSFVSLETRTEARWLIAMRFLFGRSVAKNGILQKMNEFELLRDELLRLAALKKDSPDPEAREAAAQWEKILKNASGTKEDKS